MINRTTSLLVALALVSAAAACADTAPPPVATGPTIADSAEQVLFGVRTRLERQGIRRAELYADTVYAFDQSTRMELRGVRANFYSAETGLPEGTLVAREGTLNNRQGVMDARGDVVITRPDGARLTSPHVRYLRDQDQVMSDTNFVLTEPGRRVEGIGFVTDPAMNRFEIRRTISATGGTVTLPTQ